MPQARYYIHIPQHHKEGHKLPLVLDSVRNALSATGLKGRMVIRSAEADNGDESHKTDIVIVDGEDDSTTDNAIKAVAEGLKATSNHQAIYIVKQPIETWLI